MKKIFINSIIIFTLASICHFIYDWFPNFITSVFFPVNESIFEHLKMLFTTEIIFSVLSYFFIKDKNKVFRTISRALISNIVLLVIYLPIYYLIGEILFVTLIILFITILVTEYIVSFISTKKHYKYLNVISAFTIIVSYLIFVYLTYNPLKYDLFLDKKHNKYGINILNK